MKLKKDLLENYKVGGILNWAAIWDDLTNPEISFDYHTLGAIYSEIESEFDFAPWLAAVPKKENGFIQDKKISKMMFEFLMAIDYATEFPDKFNDTSEIDEELAADDRLERAENTKDALKILKKVEKMAKRKYKI